MARHSCLRAAANARVHTNHPHLPMQLSLNCSWCVASVDPASTESVTTIFWPQRSGGAPPPALTYVCGFVYVCQAASASAPPRAPQIPTKPLTAEPPSSTQDSSLDDAITSTAPAGGGAVASSSESRSSSSAAARPPRFAGSEPCSSLSILALCLSPFHHACLLSLSQRAVGAATRDAHASLGRLREAPLFLSATIVFGVTRSFSNPYNAPFLSSRQRARQASRGQRSRNSVSAKKRAS